MKRYFIETAKYDIVEDDIACVSTLRTVVATVQFKEGSKTQWLSLVEVDGIPNVYLTDKDIHEAQVAEDLHDEEFIEYAAAHYITEFNGIAFDADYSTTFENIADDPENPAAPLIRYLIALVRCDMDEVDDLIQMASGKYADELDFPASDVEEEFMDEYEDEDDDEDDYGCDDDDDIDVDLPEDLDRETLYRMRLALETDVETESVFHDMDGEAFEAEEAKLDAVKERCEDEADFQAWKKDYIASEYEKVKGKKFLVCSYLFAGIGQYEAIIPAEEKESFICWINGSGSAFFGGEREATEDEIKKYLALQADADLN